MATHDRFVEMIRSFPTLRDAEAMGLFDLSGERFDPVAFDEALAAHQCGSGMTAAAQFVLQVWNGRYDWKIGRFDSLREAWGVWDRHHQQAFAAFWQDPVWP